MNAVERARLKLGKKVKYKGEILIYHRYSYRAHHLKDSASEWVYLSNAEIMDAEVIRE
jgi:hypothetical protein